MVQKSPKTFRNNTRRSGLPKIYCGGPALVLKKNGLQRCKYGRLDLLEFSGTSNLILLKVVFLNLIKLFSHFFLP